MSFVNNLKKVRQLEESSAAKVDSRATAFKRVSSTTTNTNTDDKLVLENDPLFPKIRLMSRYTSCQQLNEMIPENCDVWTITDYYKSVKPPKFELPATAAANLVIIGIVASKSPAKTNSNGFKYSNFLLSDLKYDINLTVQNKACDDLYKLQMGTLVAVLNPKIYMQTVGERAYNPALSISSKMNLVEIGMSKDIGQCESETLQKKRCKNWVDMRKTHFCDLHVTQRLRTKRPEFNSMHSRLWDPRQNGQKMTVVQGGEVKWKRGLQLDNQDRLVGDIYQSGGLPPKRFYNAFDQHPDLKRRKFLKDKRELEHITDDNALRMRLESEDQKKKQDKINKDKERERNLRERKRQEQKKKEEEANKDSAFDAKLFRKLGFVPPKGARAPAKPSSKPSNNEDSESELEII